MKNNSINHKKLLIMLSLSYNKLSCILLFLISLNSFGQNNTEIQNKSVFKFKSQFTQLKDQMNYGLVFKGPTFLAEYEFVKEKEATAYSIQSEFGFGTGFSRRMASLNFKFKPIRYSYYFELYEDEKQSFLLGPCGAINYNYHLYPWTHGGHTYWYSTIDIGTAIIYNTNFKGRSIQFRVWNSVFGYSSRPVYQPEEYFYDLGLVNFAKKANSNLTYGSTDKWINSELEIRLLDINKKGLAISYNLEYVAYYETPKVTYFNQAIELHFVLGKKKNK